MAILFLFALPFLYTTVLAQTDTTTTVQGRVIVGTPDGAPLPEDFQLELQVIDAVSVQAASSYTTTIEPDGGFVFNDVPLVQGNDFYLIYATYAGFRQSTQAIQADEASSVVFYVYETTDQLDDIVITNGIMRIEEFSFLRHSGVNIEVVLELVVENRGDRILYDGDTAFWFELVVGAYGYSEVTTEGSTATYLHFEDGIIPLVKDTIPLRPDWPPRTIRVSYLLEFNADIVIDVRFPVQVENLDVLIPKDTVELSSDTMRAIDDEVPGIGSNITYRLFRPLNDLQPNESLVFTLEGRPTETITNDPAAALRITQKVDEGVSLVILFVGFLGILSVFGGTWWVWRRRQMSLAEIHEIRNSEHL